MKTSVRLGVVLLLVAAVVVSNTAPAAARLNLRPLMHGIPTSLSPLKGNAGIESAANDTKIDQFVNVGKGTATWSLIINFLVETVQGASTGQPVAIPLDQVMGLLGQAPVAQLQLNPNSRLATAINLATASETQGIRALLQQHQAELGNSTVILVPCKGLTLAVVAIPVSTISTRPVHTESVNYSWSAQLWDHVNAASWWQWWDEGYFWVKWFNPSIQGAKGTVSTTGEWRCVKTWDYETGVVDDNKAAMKAEAEAYATQYGPELDTVAATGSLWGLANTGKASWGGGVVNWSCTYQGVFTDHKKITCRCVARGGHGG